MSENNKVVRLLRQPPVPEATAVRPTFRERVAWRFFPVPHIHPPEHKPSDFRDCLIINLTVSLSWKDRIRILFSGKLAVTSKTLTQFTVGNTLGHAGSYVLPPKFLCRKHEEKEKAVAPGALAPET